MRPLQLKLLGQFECSQGKDERISLPMRKADVLLAYLALAPGLRHPRERLVNLLWSDRGDEQARNSLRQCLSAIKKALGDSADLVLLIDRTTVSLKSELIEVDAHEFEGLALEGDYESLLKAASLYQGEFLEGISIRDPACQEWLESERGRFKRQFIEILTNLAETQLVTHDYNHAIKSAEKLVEQDPLVEAGWRLLMRSYFENGDRNHALLAYKRCCDVLSKELDVEPEAKTVELQEQIKRGQVDGDTPKAAQPAASQPSRSPDSDEHSIAVLPFDNLSGDPEQEYFSDGITDSIILHLSAFPGLHVKSRNSSFAFKQQIKSIGEISKELAVDYVVEGSIRKSGERIRITIQLIEAAGGNQVWGKRYDAELDNLFDLEEELSRTIAATVTGRIESDLQRIALTKGAKDQQTYDLLLAGAFYTYKFTGPNALIAIDLLNRCLELDPDNARVHALLYFNHSMSLLERWIEDYPPAFERAAYHAERAIALDPDSPFVLNAYAEYLIFSRENDKAEKYLQKALEINPNNPDPLTTLAMNQEMQGDFETAMQTAKLAYQLDPYHFWADWVLAETHFLCGQYEESLEIIAKSKNAPTFIRIYAVAAHIKLGNMEKARETLRTYLDECRSEMKAMPGTLDEWMQYTIDNSPFEDVSINQGLIDCMVQAGLEEELAKSNDKPGSVTDKSSAIVVLPFDNLSNDPDQEYFSDGITDSIILNLSLFPGLIVKSRNASFAFKQQIKDLGEISKELDVDYLVEGSIRKSGEQVRINVQLIEAATGNQVWGKRYDAIAENLFNLEAELSRTIAVTVTGRIESDLQQIAVHKGAKNQQAYDLLLEGMHYTGTGTREGNQKAIEKLNQCLEIDPTNFRAHVHLFYAHDLDVLDRWSDDPVKSRDLATEHVLEAISLEPDHPSTLVAHASDLIFKQRFDEGNQQLNKALEKNPNDSEAICYTAVNLSLQGKSKTALEQAELVLRLDPYHPWVRWIMAESQYYSKKYEDCLVTVNNTGNAPGFIQIYKIGSAVKLNQMDVAREELKKFLGFCRENMRAFPKSLDDWWAYSRDNAPFADERLNREIIDCLVDAGLEEEMTNESAASDAEALPSLLVLPFENLSGDPEQEYFSNGITESLIQNLSSFTGLQVKSRHTSFAFKDSSMSLDEIASELGVQYIIDGSVRKRGEQVRIAVQLGDTASGNQVWGKRFDTPMEELLNVEEELVQTIAGAIGGRIDHELRTTAIQKPASDLKAYDYLMRGWYHAERFNPEDYAKSIDYIKKSLELDPDNGQTHGILTGIINVLLYENWATDRDAVRREADYHINRALELDRGDALAHAFMAEHQMLQHNFKKVLHHAEKAIELNPALPDGYSNKAYYLSSARQHEAAVKLAEFSLQMDPYHFYMAWNAGIVFRNAGEYQRSIDAFRLLPYPSPGIYAELSAALVGLGEIDEAREEMSKFKKLAREQMPSYPATVEAWKTFWREVSGYQYEEDFESFFDLMRQAGLYDKPEEIFENLPSIAVLPFTNLSGDPEQEYFSDGITANVIIGLGLFKGLAVKSQRSSFAFKQSQLDSQAIAQKLNADFLVEGNIRKSENRIRLSIQLVDADSGNQAWGKQYDEELEDVLELEQELSREIAATINGRIEHQIQQITARKSASNLASYDHLMRGLYHFGKFTAKDMTIACDEFRKCIEIDPENATAHTNLGAACEVMVIENWTDDRETSLKQGRDHFDIALKLDPDNAQTHAYLSETLILIGEYEQSEYHARRAIELNPTASEGYTSLADVLVNTRRAEEAIPFAEKCLRLDPYSVGAGWVAGDAYRQIGDYAKAIKIYRAIAHPPPTIHGMVASCFVGMGLLEEARAEMKLYLELARQQMPNHPKSEDAWRDVWKTNSFLQYDEDFEAFFQQLVDAGLCESLLELSDEVPSIAILPFENMSGDPEQEHFADGLTTDIIATLFKFKHLRTVSRYSVLPYKTDKPPIEQIADQQNVRYILEGSVRKSGNRIRVSAELIDSKNNEAVWSERYDRDLEDLFAVQDEITQQIALAMKVQFDDGDMALHRSTGTINVKAWELVLTAVDLQDTYIRRNILEARDMALEAIRLDPGYPYAWISLGWTYWQEVYAGWADSMDELLLESEKACQKAFEILPDYSEAWSLWGLIQQMKHETEKSVNACQRAVELEPGNAEVQALMAFTYLFIGKLAEARQHHQNMLRLCPILPNWYYLIGGGIEKKSGNLDLAIECFQQGMEVEPESPLCRFYLIDALMENGDENRARIYADEIKALDRSLNGRGLVRANSDDPDERQRFHDNLARFDLV